jgi:hypothetical protein
VSGPEARKVNDINGAGVLANDNMSTGTLVAADLINNAINIAL